MGALGQVQVEMEETVVVDKEHNLVGELLELQIQEVVEVVLEEILQVEMVVLELLLLELLLLKHLVQQEIGIQLVQTVLTLGINGQQ